MGTYAEERTLAMLNALKRINDCSRNKEFKAILQACCDFVGEREYLIAKYIEKDGPYRPERGTYGEGLHTGYGDAYKPILSNISKYENKLIKMMGLSFLHSEPHSIFSVPFYRYEIGETSFEYFIEELKTIVWEQNQYYVWECPALIVENLTVIGLLPKKILNGFHSNLLQDEKEDATEHPKLIVEKSIKIELSAKTI